jgi:hypothetical protein
MRWTISPKLHARVSSRIHSWSHDSRTVDLLAILALLTLVLGSGWYLATNFEVQPSTTAFIVPSQSVRW